MKLETTKEKVLELAKKSPYAEQLLKSIFPEAFKIDDETIVAFIGDRFIIRDTEYLLAKINNNSAALVSLNDGILWMNAVRISATLEVSYKEFKLLVYNGCINIDEILSSKKNLV